MTNILQYPGWERYRDFLIGIKDKNDPDGNLNEYFKRYQILIDLFPSPSDVVFKTIKVDSNKLPARIQVFLCIELEMGKNKDVSQLRIFDAEKILLYFKIINGQFWDIFIKNMPEDKSLCMKYKSILLKSLMFLGLNNIKDLKFEDLPILNDPRVWKHSITRRRFIYFLEQVLIEYNNKGSNINLYRQLKNQNDEATFESEHEKCLLAYSRFIKENYESRGLTTKSAISAIKYFSMWLNENYSTVNSPEQITREMIIQYKKYIKRQDYACDTKRKKFNPIIDLFIWMVKESLIGFFIVYPKDKIVRKEYLVDDKPRMFLSREHFKAIMFQLVNFTAETEEEELFKELSLVISATGLRLSEALWIEPNCLLDEKNLIGELVLHSVDKLNIRNKKTSVHPWGVDAIKRLVERFNNGTKKKLYNDKEKNYMYSLFEYNGRILCKVKATEFLRKIFDKCNLYDEDGTKVTYEGTKFHGFRHQKFNDIFSVTGGSINAVKIDSAHVTTAMAKRYTLQNRKKERQEFYRLIDERKIVGKGAQLLSNLLESQFLPDEYIDLVKKLNISSYVSIKLVRDSLRFLGFGYCRNSKCNLAPLCEGCDYFITGEIYIPELKRRYQINYNLIKAQIQTLTQDENKSIFISLKYQEKWLRELGMNANEIEKLKTSL